MILELLTKYWRQFAAIGLLVALFGFGYYKGYSHEKIKYEAHLAEDARLTAIANAENKRRVEEAGIITANVTKEYADAVAKINEYYKSHPHIIRLCDKPIQTNAVPTKGKGSGGASTAAQGVTEIDAQVASKEIAQCQALIKWELEQEGIK